MSILQEYPVVSYPIWLLAHILQSQRLLDVFYKIHKTNDKKKNGKTLSPTTLNASDLNESNIDQYIFNKKPVLIKGLAKNQFQDDPITHESLIAKYGSNKEIVRYENNGASQEVTLEEILSPNSIYKNVTIASKSLIEKVDLQKKIGIEKWLPTKKITTAPILNKVLFASKEGFTVNLHMEGGRILNTQITGNKTWYLVPPRFSHLLRPALTTSAIQFSENIKTPKDLKEKLDGRADIYQCEMERGDVLLVPPFYWHIVENHGNSVSVAYQWLTYFRSFAENPFMNLFLLSARDISPFKFLKKNECND